MKRIFVYMLMLIMLFAGGTQAAETITYKNYRMAGGFSYLQWTVATAADGSLTKTASEDSITGLVYAIRVIPDSVTPFTASVSDVRITDDGSVDITEGGLDNLDNSVTNLAPSIFGGVAMSYPINGYLSIDILQNVVDSAEFVVEVFYIRAGGNR